MLLEICEWIGKFLLVFAGMFSICVVWLSICLMLQIKKDRKQ